MKAFVDTTILVDVLLNVGSVRDASRAEQDLREGPHSTVARDHIKCTNERECAMAAQLKARPNDLVKLRDAILKQPPKRKNVRRAKVLKELCRLPKQPIDSDACRHLGDAIFSFFAPTGAVILTTNVSDHQPLAAALGKKVESP